MPSATERRSTERIWHGTPIKDETPCIFPKNDICAGGVEPGPSGSARPWRTAASSKKAKPMSPKSDETCTYERDKQACRGCGERCKTQCQDPAMPPERIEANHAGSLFAEQNSSQNSLVLSDASQLPEGNVREVGLCYVTRLVPRSRSSGRLKVVNLRKPRLF